MKIIIRIVTVILFIFTFVLLSPAQKTEAQTNTLTSIGIANYLPVTGDRIENGDIVIAEEKGYFLSSTPYDPRAIGVVNTKPAIALKMTTGKDTYPVVNFGSVRVKVSGENGDIKQGDLIATSSLSGVGMKATQTGYVVGGALEAVTFNNPKDVKLIDLSLNVHFYQQGATAQSSIFDILSLAKTAGYQQPLRVLQYIIAGIVVIASFVFGFLIFGKTISTGIEALGRNPLAGRMIQLSIVFNVVLIIIIIMSGITLAYILIGL